MLDTTLITSHFTYDLSYVILKKLRDKGNGIMSNVAVKVEGYVPNYVNTFVNHLGIKEDWLVFLISGDMYAVYSAMPSLLALGGKTFKKMSWNSDNGSMCYKEIDASSIAKKIK